jgi:hypothetical protein
VDERVRVARLREDPQRVLVAVQRQADLLQVVGALDARRGRSHLLDGGEQQADEDGDDRDHHE